MTRLKLGMVGGGQGAFIGGVHRIAARLDGDWDLVAGALSSDPDRARASAEELGIAPDRAYATYDEMARAEAAREDGIDAVSIVTPNHLHAGPAIEFLEAGIHVICDKPLTATLEEAERIAEAAARSKAQFYLTHTYSGYPLVRQAREMVARGDLGAIRLVHVDYVQDWLAEAPAPDNKQADWRTDPARSGGGAIGDIGTHAFHLATFVTGLAPRRLSADLTSFVRGRQVDDNAEVRVQFDGGAKGHIWASQMAVGHENEVTLRVYGDKGGLEWTQDMANVLRFTPLGEPSRLLTRAGAGATPANLAASRVPAGHPEGYLEAFATLYADAATAIRGGKAGMLPTLTDGLAGMRFVAACQQSARDGTAWVALG